MLSLNGVPRCTRLLSTTEEGEGEQNPQYFFTFLSSPFEWESFHPVQSPNAMCADILAMACLNLTKLEPFLARVTIKDIATPTRYQAKSKLYQAIQLQDGKKAARRKNGGS